MKKLLFTMSALFISVTGFAQAPVTLSTPITFDVPSITLLAPQASELGFVLSSSGVAGDALTVTGVAEDYLFSTMVTPGVAGVGQNSGTITVTMTGLDDVFNLSMSTIMPNNGTGAYGTLGSDNASSGVMLDNTVPSVAFANIGTHFTGRQASVSGYKLVYSLSINNVDYGNINEDQSTALITYTLQN